MAQLKNQRGVVNVGLTKDRIQHKRSVALLVATAFLPAPRDRSFDSPINLDGDRCNNCADNLMWRPRWFAVRYARQFHDEWNLFVDYINPVVDIVTEEYYDSCWEAAIVHGLLVHDVYLSSQDQTPVWPTRQQFRAQISKTDTVNRYPIAPESQAMIEGVRSSNF